MLFKLLLDFNRVTKSKICACYTTALNSTMRVHMRFQRRKDPFFCFFFNKRPTNTKYLIVRKISSTNVKERQGFCSDDEG